MGVLSKLGLGKKGRADDSDSGFAETVGDSMVESVAQTVESIVVSKSNFVPHIPVAPDKPRKGFSLSGLIKGKAPAAAKADFSALVNDDPQLSGESVFNDPQALSTDRERKITDEVGEKPKPLPLIGRLAPKVQIAVCLYTLAACALMTVALTSVGFVRSADYQALSSVGTRFGLVTQRIMASTQSAIRGNKEAAERLSATRKEVDGLLATLSEGSSSLPGSMSTVDSPLRVATDTMTGTILPKVDQVLQLTPNLLRLEGNSDELTKVTSSAFASSEQMAALMQSGGAPDIHIAAADHIRLLVERIRRNGQSLLTSSDIRIEPLAEFNADFKALKETVSGLRNGDPRLGMQASTNAQVVDVLEQMSSHISRMEKVIDFVQVSAPALVTARSNLASLGLGSEKALEAVNEFNIQMRSMTDSSQRIAYYSVFFIVLGLIALIMLGVVRDRNSKITFWETEFRSKQNEIDIMDLMRKMNPLEMGDLTVNVVSMDAMEGITGGIRSSVNEAVISLHDAVSTVKKTATKVSDIVSISVDTSHRMKQSNERQTQEIQKVVGLLGNLTGAIGRVTDRTTEAVEISHRARTASNQGAMVVEMTNKKMTEIRGNMQDVLKSVKALGESSHEISEIVAAIENITDRTQVLAVNASLEAANAGAAGAGFEIIAREVNRLSEQSAESLKTIVALVNRIQSETGATIRVVEESTANVIEGARMSEDANTELTSISKLSESLDGIMAEIRAQSAQQSMDASNVQSSMGSLLDLSHESQVSVSDVVGNIQDIDSSMGSLKTTVSIFTTKESESDGDFI